MNRELDAGLELDLDTAGTVLRARFVPRGGLPAPTRDRLMEALGTRGWGQAKLNEPAISGFLVACHRAAMDAAVRPVTEPEGGPEDGEQAEPAALEAEIGEVLDGYFELDIDADELTVRFTLLPPQGGKPMEEIHVRTAVASRGIKAALDEDALRAAFAAGYCDNVVLAAGKPPGQGTPAQFINLLAPRRPAAVDDDNARIDLRDLGSLNLVSPGTQLMRRIPAVPGVDGVDVFGKVLPAAEVADHPYSDKLTGVARDSADAEILVAAVAGMPSVGGRGVSVNPVVDVEAVDMHSGNVAFDGTLRVKGDIKTGMTVRVAGDVIVSGTIEAAHVEAGGNVVVSGGIIGKSEAGHDPAAHARIVCKGSLQARFIESAVVEAGTTVSVEGGIRQSDVAAGESVTAGDPVLGQGAITGGRVRAWLAVKAATLGAPAGIDTRIQVGLNPYADAEKAALESNRERMHEEQAKVQQLIAFFGKFPDKGTPELREKARSTLYKYTRDLLDADHQMAELEKQLQPHADAEILAGRKIHGGVTLMIGHKSMQIMEDKPGGHFRLIEDRIALA